VSPSNDALQWHKIPLLVFQQAALQQQRDIIQRCSLQTIFWQATKAKEARKENES
jgi:hypothetical protein